MLVIAFGLFMLMPLLLLLASVVRIVLGISNGKVELEDAPAAIVDRTAASVVPALSLRRVSERTSLFAAPAPVVEQDADEVVTEDAPAPAIRTIVIPAPAPVFANQAVVPAEREVVRLRSLTPLAS